MGSYKMSNILIGLVLVSLFVAVLASYMAEISSNYGINFDNRTLSSYNKLETINSKIEEVKGATDIEQKSGTLDIIGGYFSDAYDILILTKDSFGYTYDISEQGFSQIGLGAVAGYFLMAIGAIVGIIIFIGVIVSALIGKDI